MTPVYIYTDSQDFYARPAIHMGCSRAAAKQRLLMHVYGDCALSETAMIDADARAELLARIGVIVGEN